MKVYFEVAGDAQTSAVPVEAKRAYISFVCQHITVEVEMHSHDCRLADIFLLQHLVSFLGETVKVFGADRLRSTKFLLPVDEAEIFLDDLQKMAPYSLKDLVDAAKAGKCEALLRVCKQNGALNAARCRRFYDSFRDKDSFFICGCYLLSFPWCDRVGIFCFLGGCILFGCIPL